MNILASANRLLSSMPRDKPFRAQASQYVLILCLAAVSTVYAPVVFGLGIQGLTTRDDTVLAIGLIGLYGLMVSLARVFYDLKLVAVKKIEQMLLLDASKRALNAIERQSNQFFLDHNSAKLLQIIGRYKSSISMRVHVILHSILPGLAEYLLSFLVVTFFVDAVIGAVVFAYGIGAVYLSWRSTRKLTPLLEKSQQQSIKSSSTFGNLINNIEILRYYGASRTFSASIIKNTRSEHSYFSDYFQRRVLYTSATSLLFFLQYGIVVSIVLARYFENQLDIAQLVTVNLIILQLSRPFELIGSSMKELANAEVMRSSMQHILDTTPTAAGTARPAPGKGDVGVTGLGFSFADKKLFERLDHRFTPGALNFVTGPSGAGKSTLLRLLSGQCDGYSGSATVNGNEITQVDRHQLHELVGYVPQDAFISNVSVYDNIACGRETSQEEVAAAARKARIHERILQLESGYQTHVGEGGARLCGGERQRIAIARALLHAPRILLLDEASAALDPTTEKLIFDTLRELCPATTIIAVTHRLTIIRSEDAVLKLGPVTHEADADSSVLVPA